MKALAITTLMTLGLTAGVASAEPYHRDYHHERVEHFRDHRYRPAIRFERHEARGGFRWVPGDWRWDRGEWVWIPGHYIRITRW
jgi:hypothetical protein